MLTRVEPAAGDRGASMVVALAAIAVVLGLGAVALRIVGDDALTTDRRLTRDWATQHAEFAASEGIARVVDGTETPFAGTGTIDGMDYRYTVTPTSADTWSIVGVAGTGSDVRTVTTELRRASSGAVTVVDYELWAENIELQNATGTLYGRIGASEQITVTGTSAGDEQHLLGSATCTGCANPIPVTDFAPLPTPPASGALPCPYTDVDSRIRDTNLAAGTYFCDGDVLRFSGTVTVAGPVVIHLDHDTRIEAVNASINAGGVVDDLHIVQEVGTIDTWSQLDGTSFAGDISMPDANVYLDGALSWSGRVHVGHAIVRGAILDVGEPPDPDRYAVYGGALIDVGYVRSGDVAGPIGSGDRIKFWFDHSIGTTQDSVGFCENCPNPNPITGYTTLPLPDSTGAAACPADNQYRITGPVTLSGEYLCDQNQETLEISGAISVDGPVVIHIGADTRLDIRGATINSGGASTDFVIAKPTTTTWSYRSTIDDTTLFGRILAPETWMYVGDVTWRGTFEVETWWLYDWANVDGAWDGGSVVEPPPTTVEVTSWHLDRWQLS